MRLKYSSCVPWLKLRRATFMPARINSIILSSVLTAGPMVQMILVRLGNSIELRLAERPKFVYERGKIILIFFVLNLLIVFYFGGVPIAYDDLTVRRLHVRINGLGQTVCAIDTKTNRFGRVFANGKQGMHLFSVGYTLASMAMRFTDMRLIEAAEEVTTTFHTNLLTKFVINSKYQQTGRKTIIANVWREYFVYLITAFKELCDIIHDQKKRDALEVWIATRPKVINRNIMTDKKQVDSLEDYLNLAGAIQHVLPCNVIYADKSTDAMGGALASAAILNFRNKGTEESLKEDIKKIIDPKVVAEMFSKGFEESNNSCLAFIIMQISELCALRALFCNRPTNNTFFWIATMRQKKDYIYEVAHFASLGLDKGKYSMAFENALNKLYDARHFLESHLHTPDHILDKLEHIF